MADTDEAAGKAGSDVALLILLSFIAIHTSELVVAGWLTKAEGLRAGLTIFVGTVGRAISIDLVVLLIAGLALTIAAGKRRSVGRDFDLGCVVFVPYIVVKLVAHTGASLVGVAPPAFVNQVISVAAYSWAVYVWVLAWQHTRARSATR